MDWNKFLNILIFTLAFTLIFQWFFSPKEHESIGTVGTVYLATNDDTTVLPNIPEVEIHNTTTGSVNIDTCRDVAIFINSQEIRDIAKEAPGFCTVLTILPNSQELLPLPSLSRVFAELTGKYFIKVKASGQETVLALEHSPPGAIRSTLSAVVYEPIYNLFIALLSFLPGHNLGWAIIVITLIIRVVLLAPQNQMLRSQKKLQKIQPKIKALQEKYKEDKVTLGSEMLALYKKEGVNPMGSLLPLIIQMPILIGLYWVVSGVNEPSNFYHLYSFFRDFDVTSISPLFYGLDLRLVGGIEGGIFALALGIIQWLQAKLSFSYNPPVKATPKIIEKSENGEYKPQDIALDPAIMQKMMLYILPVMIAVSSFFFPLGIALYWFVGTLFVIVQQRIVNRGKEK